MKMMRHTPASAPGSRPAGASRPPLVLQPGRLDVLARRIALLYRRAHLTPAEAKYVHRRARGYAGIRGLESLHPRRLPDLITAEELEAVLAQAYREQARDGLLVRTLFETGLRVAELSRADASDLDWTERTLRVRSGKGGKDRLVLFTRDLGQQLRLHLAGRDRGAIFLSVRAGRISVRRIQEIVSHLARRAGLQKRVHPHLYRHSMATWLINHGVPKDHLQLLLGHDNPRTTDIYARLGIGPLRDGYDRAMGQLRAGAVMPSSPAT